MERREVLKQSLMAKALRVGLECLLLSLPSFPQTPTHQHVAPPTVRGDEHPEKVSDERVWLMQLIASTASDTDDELTKNHALIHRQSMGLNGFDAAPGDFQRPVRSPDLQLQQHRQRAAGDPHNRLSAGGSGPPAHGNDNTSIG